MLEMKHLYDIHPAASGQKKYYIDILRYAILFCAGGFAILLGTLNGWSLTTIDELVPSNEQLEMVMNKSALVRLNEPAKRVSIVSPEIADVQILECKELLLTAQSVGETTLVVWQEDGSVRTIDVIVRVNTRPITEALSHTMPDEAIEVMPMNNGVALRGQVQGLNSAGQAMEIANSYSPQVVNLMNVPGAHQVLLKVRIAEVARTFREEIGVNFQVLDNSIQGTSTLGGLTSGTLNQPNLTVSEAVTMFMGLPNSNINAFIQALEEKGMLHILAEPNLVAHSGETASFLAGGEFPVPVVQSGLTNSISVEYKEFGVRLKFTPTVLDTQNIKLDISPEVSDLDFAQGIRLGGYLIPIVVTRRAQTVVNLSDGQSFAIAGLISTSKQKTKRKVPFVSNIPIFGGLFKGGDITEKETELLIMVTPHLVAPMNNALPQPMPGDSIKNTEPNPFLPEETGDAPVIQPEPSVGETGPMQDDIPTIYPHRDNAVKGSKVRSIRSNSVKKAPVTWHSGKIEDDSLLETPPETTIDDFANDNNAGPVTGVDASENITIESPVLNDLPMEMVEPVERRTFVPSSLPARPAPAKRKSQPKTTPESHPHSAVISQNGFMKPGMMPVEKYPVSTRIAYDGMPKYKGQSRQKNSPLKAVAIEERNVVVIASRID